MKRIRNKMLRIRLTEDEYDLIKTKAEDAGMSRTAFILHSIEHHTTNVVGEELKNTYLELHRRGINLNQITHHINSDGTIPEGFQQLVEENRSLLKAVRKYIEIVGRVRA